MSTTIIGRNVITIKNPNLTSDWTMANTSFNDLPNGIPVSYMVYTPGASRDVVMVREDVSKGMHASANNLPILVKFECANSWDQKIVYFHGRKVRPRIDITAGSKGKKATSTLNIYFD
jgi:hypothetical protein